MKGPRINNLICSVAGSGAGKTYFLDCLFNWNKYKEDILKSLNPSSRIYEMVENENLVTCGVTFDSILSVTIEEKELLDVQKRFWL